jgi:hypothetical protein
MVDQLALALPTESSAVPASGTGRSTRAQRLAQPTAREVVKAVALEHGACIRPVQLRRTNLETGEVEQVMIPCGGTLASICPSCAERAKALRAQQCREGWHLEEEPAAAPGPPDQFQKWLIERLADLQAARDQAEGRGEDTADFDDVIEAIGEELASTGVRGHPDPSRKNNGLGHSARRRHRSTRRRHDAPELPGRKVRQATLGRVYRAPGGQLYRPSMFITLTCPSYGAVRDDGTPLDSDAYDYESAARDAVHFAALFDRFIQNLRRFGGFEVQYFAVIEPQRRLAPHVHLAIRGTISRAELRKVLDGTYHQVWWPCSTEVLYDGDHLPVWHEASHRYVDPDTGEFLPTWDEALDAIGQSGQPRHVVRFGSRFDAQGVLAGSTDASKCIGYLTKYLVKELGECHRPETDAQRAHVARMVAALEYEPCSPMCANWLRYGITPKNPRPGLMPGACKGKAHRPEHLGYAGRRVLVSRRWSGKTLADHRGDRQAWLLEMLGLPADQNSAGYRWQRVTPADPDYLPLTRRLICVVQDRMRWKRALVEARRRAQLRESEPMAAGRAA